MDWLDTRFSFSFADYHDPAHMGFGALRVLNEDWIAPGAGFGMHPHRDMEILTWVLEGELEHRDSEGNRSVLRPGRVQRMRAGRGIWHSEINPSPERPVHLLQIWIHPDRRGLEPGHAELDVALADGEWTPLATASGRLGGLDLHQDASVYALRLGAGQQAEHTLAPGRRAWVQLVRGRGDVGEVPLEAGDGLGLTDVSLLKLKTDSELEALVFDLA
jgi:redox-sensitive bicupin YhaK (pirin superfamily)